jgi:hypothetical protein
MEVPDAWTRLDRVQLMQALLHLQDAVRCLTFRYFDMKGRPDTTARLGDLEWRIEALDKACGEVENWPLPTGPT